MQPEREQEQELEELKAQPQRMPQRCRNSRVRRRQRTMMRDIIRVGDSMCFRFSLFLSLSLSASVFAGYTARWFCLPVQGINRSIELRRGRSLSGMGRLCRRRGLWWLEMRRSCVAIVRIERKRSTKQ